MFKIFIIFVSYLLLFINQLNAESRIRIVGSKTLYYFLTFVVEDFSKLKRKLSPIVEATGSGNGIYLFCKKKINIAASSRPITNKEKELCKSQGVKKIEELILGYDAIIFAASNNSKLKNLSSVALYKGISAKLPFQNKMVENFYNEWNQIDNSLPNQDIEIYGPSDSSGTKQILMDKLAMKFCNTNILSKINLQDENSKICFSSRKDSRYIEIGENQNLLIHKILLNKNSIAILNYSHVMNFKNDIKILSVDNIFPNQETIAAEIYPFNRALYLYYDEEDLDHNDDLSEFITHIRNSNLLGLNGILSTKGLIYK